MSDVDTATVETSKPPPVKPKPKRTRRRVTDAYKLKLIEEWRNAIDADARKAMFARERINPSTLRNWRRDEKEIQARVANGSANTVAQSNAELVRYRLIVELIEALLIERDGEDSELAALVSSLRQVAM